ncbi:unnamed protein product [Kluyveromyces dobzhanskii CBS 2104]|uniref:Transcription factor STP1 n=1 Tax=Kluyveromyces dobzhanskii CBS 2104 TaxID=1427455 RepID=A0A0A8L9R1_9SACH|nr:unnamed protein product [Kluyveromyces dobzhanskii CBS 2104]
MPSVQLLDTDRSMLKRLSWRLTNWFTAIARHAVGLPVDSGIPPKDAPSKAKSKNNATNSDFETDLENEKLSQPTERHETVSLFPTSNNLNKQLEYNPSVVPCSLDINGLQSPMSVARTPEGQMEWKMTIGTEHVPSQGGLPVSTSFKRNEVSGPKTTQDITPKTDTTPGSSVTSSQEDSKDSSNDTEDITKSDNCPVVYTPGISNDNMSVTSTDSESQTLSENADEKKDADMKYICHYCDAEFKMRGYLTRHIKKHAVEKAYHCPFWDESLPQEKRCHSTGGFSRRDSYKTHLRSRHFVYPNNVKNLDRVNSRGDCGQCKKHFSSTNEWIEHHIENRQCEAILPTFKGNLKKSKKCGKLKMIMTSDGQSRFISNQATVNEAKVPLNNFGMDNHKKLVNGNCRPINSSPPIKQSISDINLDNAFGLNSIPLNYSGLVNEPIQGDLNSHQNNYGLAQDPHKGLSKDAHSLVPSNSFTFASKSQLISKSDSQNPTNPIQSRVQPLDEFAAFGKSPVEDAVLDSVRSISSRSSHEHTMLNKDMNFISPNNVSQMDAEWEVLPLDAEQAGMCMEDEVKLTNSSTEPKINTTLQRQMNEYALGERHFRETQQFMNFFNYTYNYQD